MLSFLYHRQPRSLFTILTGNSVSGQSDVFRVKSVAAAKIRRKAKVNICSFRVQSAQKSPAHSCQQQRTFTAPGASVDSSTHTTIVLPCLKALQVYQNLNKFLPQSQRRVELCVKSSILTDKFVLSRKVEVRVEFKVSRPALSPLLWDI